MDAPALEPAEFVFRGNVTAEDVCRNIRINAGRPLPTVEFAKICICASGPSLADHVEEIKQRIAAGWKVAAMNGSYNFLQKQGIVADYFFMVDARKGINLPFITRPRAKTTFCIASQCDPEIFGTLAGHDVLIWQVANYDGAVEAIRESRADPGAIFLGNLNVGLACLNPIFALGFREWALFGFDSCAREGATHAFYQAANAGEHAEPLVEFFFPLDARNQPVEGLTRRFMATPTMAHAAQAAPARIAFFRRNGVHIEIRGDGLLPHMVRVLAGPGEGGTTAPEAPEAPKAPAPLPRRRPVERLPIVTFKWAGHIPYSDDDVRIWANQWGRHMRGAFELLCITDTPDETARAAGIKTLPMWRDAFEFGRDWHRLRLFAEEMADMIGPRFVVSDLDTLVLPGVHELVAGDEPFKAWRDPNRDQYCTALFMMDAGAFPHVWRDFDRAAALRLRESGLYGGYDQAWISYVLPGQPRWTAADGVLSFRKDLLGNRSLYELGGQTPQLVPPPGARLVNFHGQYKPRDPAVQAAFPWIAEHYR